MPSQHSTSTTPVHVRVPLEVKAAAVERAGVDGATLRDVVEHALREYAAGRFTPPPAR